MWEEPALAAFLGRLASFGRIVCFDKRGSGASDRSRYRRPTDARTVDGRRRGRTRRGRHDGGVGHLGHRRWPDGRAAGRYVPGAGHRSRTGQLVRAVGAADDYPIGMPVETTAKLVQHWEENWGITAEILGLTAPSLADDERARQWFTRFQRLTMTPGAAVATYRWVLARRPRGAAEHLGADPGSAPPRRAPSPHRLRPLPCGPHPAGPARRARRRRHVPLPRHAGGSESLLSRIESSSPHAAQTVTLAEARDGAVQRHRRLHRARLGFRRLPVA
jgi:hypothetical protein